MTQEILKKKDFIEIEFSARTKEGDIFDSNIKEEISKITGNHGLFQHHAKPFVFSLGEGMFLRSVDDFLIGKSFSSVDKKTSSYEIELQPEKAFGQRDQKMVQIIPLKIFSKQKINPVQGDVFNFDGRVAKILSASGGRVIVDFNHPLSGKTVIYNIRLLRKVTDLKEKIKAFSDFIFRKEMKFDIDEKTKKIIFEAEKPMIQFVELFSKKFKEIFGLDLDAREPAKDIKPLPSQ